MNRKKVIILAGATGSGKTDLVQSLDPNKFEIISFDSRQIYKEISIGVAKPNEQQLCKIKHHLVDYFEPNLNFTVTDYCYLAEKSLNDILKKKKSSHLNCWNPFLFKSFFIWNIEQSNSSTRNKKTANENRTKIKI